MYIAFVIGNYVYKQHHTVHQTANWIGGGHRKAASQCMQDGAKCKPKAW